MFAKKESNSSSSSTGYRKQLDYLYARKSAIDALIQSLEEYDRFRAKSSANSKLKTA